MVTIVCSGTGPDLVTPIAIFCVSLLIASGIYALRTSRKNPGNLSHALQLHGFTILLVIAIGSLIHFLGCYHNFMTESITKDHVYLEAMNEIASDKAVVAKHGIWFALIAIMGSFVGALALLIKKRPQAAPRNH